MQREYALNVFFNVDSDFGFNRIITKNIIKTAAQNKAGAF